MMLIKLRPSSHSSSGIDDKNLMIKSLTIKTKIRMFSSQASSFDVTEVKPATLTVQEDDYFSFVFEADRDGCVQKLVCGLSGNAPEQLSEDGEVIMSLFR